MNAQFNGCASTLQPLPYNLILTKQKIYNHYTYTDLTVNGNTHHTSHVTYTICYLLDAIQEHCYMLNLLNCSVTLYCVSRVDSITQVEMLVLRFVFFTILFYLSFVCCVFCLHKA